jgi:hypothetical protein
VFVTNHVLAGALIGRYLGRHPAGAFGVGVVSHFLMDACPHWGFVGEDDEEPDWERLLPIARCDGCLGLAAMAVGAGLAPGPSKKAVVAGMAGAAFPDLDKPAKYFLGFDPFPEPIRRLHKRVQNQAPHRMNQELVTGTVLLLGVGWVMKRL